MVTQQIDKITFQMSEVCDFSFLSEFGQVFCVFDQNDSGNISFGTDDGSNKYFIKVAGAKTAKFSGETGKVVTTLQNAISTYEALRHNSLIELIKHYRLNELYIAVFRWSEGECLYDHWNFEMYSKNPTVQSPFIRFKQLSIEKRLHSINQIFEFLSYIESKGFVAVDFYDGSILYDFKNDITTICDIDFFRMKPTYNDMGENYWGTKRLKAPEEYIFGEIIDEVTNVFTMGALIFHIFGKYTETDINQMYQNNSFFPCSIDNWELSEKLYEVTVKAVKKDRKERYNSVSELFFSWKEAFKQ